MKREKGKAAGRVRRRKLGADVISSPPPPFLLLYLGRLCTTVGSGKMKRTPSFVVRIITSRACGQQHLRVACVQQLSSSRGTGTRPWGRLQEVQGTYMQELKMTACLSNAHKQGGAVGDVIDANTKLQSAF